MRRLASTMRSRRNYITIDDLRDWRARGKNFVVHEADTGDDIPRVLLA
jgi:polyhydroxyalkanoate synthesis regulator protein